MLQAKRVALSWPVLLVGACVVLSVDPIITDKDALFDPRLVGRWEAMSGSASAVISRANADNYVVEYIADGQTAVFEGRLGRLGDRLVLDVSPTIPDKDVFRPYAGVLIEGHLLIAVEIEGDELRVSTLNSDSMSRALASGEVRLEHGGNDDRPILYGKTETLRAVLAAYMARPGVFDPAEVWKRLPDASPRPGEVPCFDAAAWREADRLFHRDPHWVGADVASSVDLGNDRILWLFGDTWIDSSGKGTRWNAKMISNSVAIQTGRDPSRSSITFYWGTTANGEPDAFFPDSGSISLWFGHGIKVRDKLLLFMAPTRRDTRTGLGFEHLGWTAVLVENPEDLPPSWRVRRLHTPTSPLGVLLGYAGLLRSGDYVYAFGSQKSVKSHPVYAARWRIDAVTRGDLRDPEWWAGRRDEWVPDSSSAARWPLFEYGASDLSIHRDSLTQRFLQVQATGFGPADLVMRAAPELTGPWTSTRLLYRPPDYYRRNVMIYSAKAHPYLAGADLVLSYATNTFEFAELFSDQQIYYPHFVRLTRCGNGG